MKFISLTFYLYNRQLCKTIVLVRVCIVTDFSLSVDNKHESKETEKETESTRL